MDIEFIVQDTFSQTRPLWKLATNLEEASKAFQLAIAQDQKNAGLDKLADQDDTFSGESSDDEGADGDGELVLPEPDGDGDSESDEDAAEVCLNSLPPSTFKSIFRPKQLAQDLDNQPDSPRDSGSDEEKITVTRKAEQVDPEDEADFDREYAKMMAESLESRKFDRKPLFDVPLPVRSKGRESSTATDSDSKGHEEVPRTMAFSLITKKGTRQQVSLFDFRIGSETRGALLIVIDPHCGNAFRLDICCGNEEPAAGRARRTAAHQESSS